MYELNYFRKSIVHLNLFQSILKLTKNLSRKGEIEVSSFKKFFEEKIVQSPLKLTGGARVGEGGILIYTLIEAETLILLKCSNKVNSATLANFFVMRPPLFYNIIFCYCC